MRIGNLQVVLVLASSLTAQTPTTAPTPAQQAQRLARELELPPRRANAVDELLRIGEPAVPVLLQQARHPDLVVARTALHVIASLGHDGLTAVPRLQELAKGTDAHAQAAAWALARLPHRGTILVPSLEEGVVRELDADGKEVWCSGKIGRVWSACILANGNLLAAEVNGGAREYDAKGEVVWEHARKVVHTAERLVDGNTLLTSMSEQLVLEVDTKGEEVWVHRGCSSVHAARLPNGVTLVADTQAARIVEVDAAGTVVWKLDGCPAVQSFHRLRDGSTLVLLPQQRKASIRGRDGKQLAELQLSERPSDVVLVPDGWIESGHKYVRRCDAQGKERWRVSVAGWVGRVTLR